MARLNQPITDWRSRKVWVIGASSGIGAALASALHKQGAMVAVSARSAVALEDLCLAHPGMVAAPMDAVDPVQIQSTVQRLESEVGLDVVVYCAGYYQPMRAQTFDLAALRRHWQVNYDGWLMVLEQVLPLLQGRGSGHLSALSSVAAYRALPKALAYGPTKAALTHLMQGLYVDLKPANIDVSVVSPGFVSTPMTAQNDFQMPALISPDEAARCLLDGWARGEFEIHFPKRFTRVMKVLSWLPWRWYFAITRRLVSGDKP